jgi:hypothetical protein
MIAFIDKDCAIGIINLSLQELDVPEVDDIDMADLAD